MDITIIGLSMETVVLMLLTISIVSSGVMIILWAKQLKSMDDVDDKPFSFLDEEEEDIYT
ncbi:hypothetical protein ACERII_18960 [Evansella sp. AB-rgal1]|uniref:hypothetical protein n=1 Tax=Evansella sp. AB-rgal1 TaxID=3242696 RepID=UPI00359D73F4